MIPSAISKEKCYVCQNHIDNRNNEKPKSSSGS